MNLAPADFAVLLSVVWFVVYATGKLCGFW